MSHRAPSRGRATPTAVMPMVAWAKLTMAVQSLISLTVVGLVIARAVNVFA
jgi:hypothetical protein